MDAHFFRLDLRLLGATLWMHAELTEENVGGDHALRHLRPLRFNTEGEALRALDRAGVGYWSSFPYEGVSATLSRSQLRTVGFRGNF